MKTIGIDQYLSNRDSFEQKCLNKVKIYINIRVSVMNQKKIQYILEADMVYNLE